jgi:hypothetical protein
MHWCNVADDIPCDMDVGLRESTTMAQNNGYSLLVRVGESGESTQGSRRDWSRKLVRATMVAGWENKVKGPWINHSCCPVHCNCEYVPTEFVRDRKGGSFSVNVRTTRDVHELYRRRACGISGGLWRGLFQGVGG